MKEELTNIFEVTINCEKLARRLEELNNVVNNGKGFEHIKMIINNLQEKDIETARINCEQQRDKFGSPEIQEIKELLKKSLWKKGEDSPWPTPEEWQKKMSEYNE